MPSPREQTLHCFSTCLSDRSLLRLPETCTDSAFIRMLSATAFRRMVFVESVLARCLHKKIPAKNKIINNLLCLGTTELLFMETPPYAVINDWVRLAKKLGGQPAANLVNAVLRRISRDKETFLAEEKNFFPESFRSILKQDFQPETIARIAAAANTEPPLALSVKNNAAAWAQKLGGQHLAANTVILKNAGKIPSLPGFAEGEWWVQDYAASLAATILGNVRGLNILDLCAAPGGKAAQLLNAGAVVSSLDSSPERLETLRKNITRLNLPLPEIICADAVDFLKNYAGPPFDAILLDAPCSASGIFRRHPEIIHFKTKADVQKQAALQKQILNVVSGALKPGGILVYCVCSIAGAEGIAQIRKFLQQNPAFKIIPVTPADLHPASATDLSPLITPEGFIRPLPFMLPDFGGTDAFFIAKLQKGN